MSKGAELAIARSCDLDMDLTLRISSYSGPRSPKALTSILGTPEMHAGWNQPLEVPSGMFVRFQLWSDNKCLSVPFQTAFKPLKPHISSTNDSATGHQSVTYTWNQDFRIPIKIKDLPLNAQITLTIYDTRGPPAATAAVALGGATLKLFGKNATFKRGKQRCFLWQGTEADGRLHSTTPAKVPLQPGEQDEMGRLEKVSGRKVCLANSSE